MARRVVFPTSVSLRTFATAELSKVVPSGSERVAIYSLDPVDEPEYAACVESLRGVDGLRFSPLVGFWSSYRVIDLPRGDAKADLYFGVDESVLRSHIGAMLELKSSRVSIVPEFLIRSFAFGYLEKVGA